MRLVFDNPSCHRISDLSDLPRCLVKFRENPVKPDPFLQLLHFIETSFTNSTHLSGLSNWYTACRPDALGPGFC